MITFAQVLLMITRIKVEQHLKEIKLKMDIFGILFFDHRGKNQQFLLDQEIAPLKRKEIIRRLKVEDYVDGPLEEQMHNLPEMWVFGKQWKETEIYIKSALASMTIASFAYPFMMLSTHFIIHLKRFNNEKPVYR